jgi:CRP-like cAMP-binding protein
MVCHSLSAEALAHLREHHPQIALAVLRNVSRALAERLRDTTRAITHLTE